MQRNSIGFALMSWLHAILCLTAIAAAAIAPGARAFAADKGSMSSVCAEISASFGSSDHCPAGRSGNDGNRASCLARQVSYQKAMAGMCTAWSGRVEPSLCAAACEGGGFDFAAWSCRSVTGNARFTERCMRNGRELADRRRRECVASCSRDGPVLPGSLLPTRPASSVR